MAQFSSIVDFNGFYTGSYDGRQAELEIVVSHPAPNQPIGLTLKFVDIDRNQEYSANIHLAPQENTSHVLRDITLHASDGSGNIQWSRLHLHTWNTKYLSGVSIWNGQEFGMSYQH